MIASQVASNRLLANVITMLSLLVKYGYYDDVADVNEVLTPLLKVLNGLTDLPFPVEDTPDNGRLPISHPLIHWSDQAGFLVAFLTPTIFSVIQYTYIIVISNLILKEILFTHPTTYTHTRIHIQTFCEKTSRHRWSTFKTRGDLRRQMKIWPSLLSSNGDQRINEWCILWLGKWTCRPSSITHTIPYNRYFMKAYYYLYATFFTQILHTMIDIAVHVPLFSTCTSFALIAIRS